MSINVHNAIIENIKSSDIKKQVFGFQQAIIHRVPLDALVTLLSELSQSPSPDVRWMVTQFLKEVMLKNNADINRFFTKLKLLYEDQSKPSWLANTSIGKIGEEAIGIVGLQEIRDNNQQNLETWIKNDDPKAAIVLRYLGSNEISRLVPLLEKLLGHSNPELRGSAAKNLASFYATKSDWDAIQRLLIHKDYAIRWYALSSLDDKAEFGLDISALFPSLLRIFERTNEDIEKDHNVGYPITIRQLAANVLSWQPLKRDSISLEKPFLIHGVDIKRIPDLRKLLREIKKLAKEMENP